MSFTAVTAESASIDDPNNLAQLTKVRHVVDLSQNSVEALPKRIVYDQVADELQGKGVKCEEGVHDSESVRRQATLN